MAFRKLVSIDLGSRYIHILEGIRKKGQLQLTKSVLLDSPDGLFSDGVIEEAETLKDYLLHSLKENEIKTRKVVFTIPGTQIISRDMVLPKIEGSELNSAVNYEIEQYLPSDIRDYSVEYVVCEELTEESVVKIKVRVAAMKKEIVETYYELAKSMKMHPVALDIHPNAIMKLLGKDFGVNDSVFNTDKTTAVIDFGSRNTSINIVKNGNLEFNRVIKSGGRDIDLILASEYNLSMEKAEAKKMEELDISRLSYKSDAPESFESMVYMVINQIVSEIQKVFQYYINRQRGNRIEEVFIYGGASNMKGLIKFLQQQLSISAITNIQTINQLTVSDSIKEQGLEFFLNAAGAMIRY